MLENNNRIVEITADGSATIYLPDIDEHYHSVKGALTESEHIYRDCALKHSAKEEVRVLEIGFGTGLNAVVTALDGTKKVEYITLELYPLELVEIEILNYSSLFNEEGCKLYSAIHNSPWNELVEISPTFSINKMKVDFTQMESVPNDIDIVYFDAFAPEKQPEMWSKSCFEKIYNNMTTGGILTTYCAKGELRRLLQSIGFKVERIAGPVGGKREILRATK